jgi:hypothetical protein
MIDITSYELLPDDMTIHLTGVRNGHKLIIV